MDLFTDDPMDAIYLVARNVPSANFAPKKLFLIPQNAWPWHPGKLTRTEFRHLAPLRVASTAYMIRADAVLRISEAIPRGRRDAGAVIHNVLDEAFEVAERDSERLNLQTRGGLFMFGGLSSYRNVDRLLEAYRRYRADGGALQLTIAGTPVDKTTVRRIAEKASSTRGVIFRPESIERSELVAICRQSHGVIFPGTVEASPVSVLEALAVNGNIAVSEIKGHRSLLDGESLGRLPHFHPLRTQSMAAGLVALENGAPNTTKLSTAEGRWAAREQWVERIAAVLLKQQRAIGERGFE